MMTFFSNALLFPYAFIPEIFFTTCILAQLLFNTKLRGSERFSYNSKNRIVFSQTFIILIILYFLYDALEINVFSPFLIFYNNGGTVLLKKIIIIFSLFALIPIANAFYLQSLNFFEFYTLFLFSVLASLLLVSSTDFLTIYLLLEMQALCFYVLAIFRKNNIFCVTAGVKYFIFGSIVSCILLFGFSLLYGAVGTLNLYCLSILFISFPFPDAYSGINFISVFAVLLILLVLLFKLGSFPFHFWVLEVYEGSPISSTIIFSYLPKLVLFDLLLKITHIFSGDFSKLKIIFTLSGLITVVIGSFMAFNSLRIKQFLICSSISQVGFPIVILGSTHLETLSSIYFFILFYLISNILGWTIYVTLYQFFSKNNSFNNEETQRPLYLIDLSTIFVFDKKYAFVLAVLFFSMAGLPPFSGFLSKFIVLFDLLLSQNYYISYFLLFSSLLSVGYYVRLIKLAFFEVNSPKINNISYSTESTSTFYFLQGLILVLGIFFLYSSFFFLDSWLLFSRNLYFLLYF